MKTPAVTARGKTPRAAAATTTAANPLAIGRCAYAQAARWMPYVDHDVLAAATRTAWWPRWLKIANAEPATLTAPGVSAPGTFLTGARPIQVRRWYDGCVAELRLTSTEGSSRRLRRALRRCLNDLGATVDPVGPAIICGAWDAPALPALGHAGR